MRRSMLIAVGAILMVASIGAGYSYSRTPTYALSKLRSAIEDRNRLAFEQYVDVEGVASSTIDEILAKSTLSGIRESNSGFEALGTLLGGQVADQMKGALVQEFRSSLLRAVETGRLDSMFVSSPADSMRQLDLAMLAAQTASDQMVFVEMGKINRQENVAVLPLKFRNELLDTTLVLGLRMERLDGNWKITRPDNLSDYLSTVEELQEQHLSLVNAHVQEQLNSMLKVSPLRRRVDTGGFFRTFVRTYADLENRSDYTITQALVQIYDSGVPVHERALIANMEPIPPGESVVGQGAIEYNQYTDWHRTIRHGDNLTVAPIGMFYLKDGEETLLMQFENWDLYVSYLKEYGDPLAPSAAEVM